MLYVKINGVDYSLRYVHFINYLLSAFSDRTYVKIEVIKVLRNMPDNCYSLTECKRIVEWTMENSAILCNIDSVMQKRVPENI